ncbi:MAG: cadherin domain-containing protein [Isosphaeraceae bacterium]
MKTHLARRRSRHSRRSLLEELECRALLATGTDLSSSISILVAPPPNPPGPEFNLAQTLSDQAQVTTLAFDALAMMTGNLDAQSFFPPGKVADYTGFQFLRDNDPDNMGHNTSFLTRIANNVIFTLNDAQFAQLKTLATAQLDQINQYGYERYTLMEAFRRLMDGNVPAGSSGLDLNAVKAASRALYQIDGQISFDRALLYARVLNSLSPTQKAYLDAMKGKGFNSWPDITNDQIRARMQGLPQGTAVAVMTYASDLFSWYAGSVDADVYFCPERHGTYYGGFYIKDAPAVGHEGYSISEQLTATAGAALCDSSQGYVTPAQAALMSSLVETQRNNLYAGATNIVGVRTQIATLLRGLLTSTASSDAVKAQVIALSNTYGDLDGENNYNYANVFTQVYRSLTSDQKTRLMALRKSIMSGTYADGTPFDYTVCTTPFLYSGVINDPALLAPYVSKAATLFATPTVGSIALSSTQVDENLPAGTVVGTLSMSGAASGAVFSYSLVTGAGSTGNADFQILDGVLETLNPLDHEARSSESIRVRATDQYGNATESAFTIDIADVNEAPAVGAASVVVPWSSPAGTAVVTPTVTDPDGGQAQTWSIVGGNIGGAFGINSATGRITVASPAALASLAGKSVTLTVGATDNGVPALSGTATVTIQVTAVVQGPTGISLSATSVAENRPAGTVVGLLSATDTYASPTFTYRLVPGLGGDNNLSFAIVGRYLVTRTSFNHEAKNSYSIRIRATDQRGLSFEKAITIGVTDVNEAPVVQNVTRTLRASTLLNFQASDFSSAFLDPDGSALASVQIVSAPARGVLMLGGVVVRSGRVIPVGLLGSLIYVPPKNFLGVVRFTWTGSDGQLSARTPGLVSISVV